MYSGFRNRALALATLIAAVFVLAGCGHVQPIYNVEQHSIPAPAQKLTLEEIGRNIVLAAAPRHWVAEQVALGEVRASYSNGQHKVQIAINYSRTGYSIHFVSSVNMEEKGGNINHNYNKWIRSLDQDIQNYLYRAGLDHG
jgi:hypothetical protein